jgi:putative membrane protein
MAHKVSHLFSSEDLKRIESAVHEAEKTTSGEIVPFLVDRSDDYEEAEWRAGALLGSSVLLLVLAEHALSKSWLPVDFALILLLAFLADLLGMFLTRMSPPLKRFFSGRALLERRVGLRATQAFVSEKVFDTQDRTGILLFVSVLEHRVLVIGDEGINARVKPAAWEEIVHSVTRAIRDGQPTEGLVDAIARCGKLLQQSGVERRPDDTDELSNELRMRNS